MQLIHTADWHLCDRLGRINRTDDLKIRVERVAQLCEEHQVDLLLIAGDLFSDKASVDDMTESLRWLREVFTPFFARRGTILALTGNHDRDGRINMVRAGMTLAAPAAGHDGLLEPGRMYLLNGRAVARLADRSGEVVQFVIVPYPSASRYGLSATAYRTKEEENRLLRGQLAAWLQSLPTLPEFDVRLPTVLAAHLYVRGAEIGTASTHVPTERDVLQFDIADLNPHWAYVALGDVHKPQMLQERTNVRYSGSLDRLDFGETHDDHGVYLVQIGRRGLACEPERLPIPATAFHTIVLDNPEVEIPALAERYPDRDSAIFQVTVTPFAPGPSRDEIAREIRHLFPRLHELKWVETPRENNAEEIDTFAPRADFTSTIRNFVMNELAGDPDKERVLALADEFLRTEVDS
jgi:exonuclease SbcD